MNLHLERELDNLRRKLLSLSSMVELNLSKAIKALNEHNEDLARQVKEGDKLIDAKEVELEEDCLKILALYQPVAIDLRFVIAVLKINNDLERIGDLAVSIARRAYYLSHHKTVVIPFDYNEIVEKTKWMLSEALESLIKMDTCVAQAVMAADDEVDALNRVSYEKVFEGIRKNPDNVEMLIHCLTISKSLERIADYATNIAEDVVYMINGKIVRHGVDHQPETSLNN